MLTVGGVVVGVDDVERGIRFWTAALGYEVDAPKSHAGDWATLRPRAGAAGTLIYLQRNDTRPVNRPRMHLDLDVHGVEEQESEADRLVALGARRVDWDLYPEDPDFIVLADPDDNLFCIVDADHVDAESQDT
jgi:catechol 2,3-dioxygenase-like lactoylglutathione lyase family enzyme